MSWSTITSSLAAGCGHRYQGPGAVTELVWLGQALDDAIRALYLKVLDIMAIMDTGRVVEGIRELKGIDAGEKTTIKPVCPNKHCR